MKVLIDGSTTAIVAAILHIVAYTFYWIGIWKGGVLPNPVSWLIWVFITWVTALTYLDINGDILKASGAWMSAGLGSLTLILLFMFGNYGWPKKTDWMAAVLGVSAILGWIVFHSSLSAYFLVQIADLVGFSATFLSVHRSDKKEHRSPWFVWALAYFLGFIVVLHRWDSWEDVVYYFNSSLLHLGVAIVETRRRFRKS